MCCCFYTKSNGEFFWKIVFAKVCKCYYFQVRKVFLKRFENFLCVIPRSIINNNYFKIRIFLIKNWRKKFFKIFTFISSGNYNRNWRCILLFNVVLLGLLSRTLLQLFIFFKPLKIMGCKELIIFTPLLELILLFTYPILHLIKKTNKL